MVRIAARRWLLPDLDQSIASLQRTFDCRISVASTMADGSRTAAIGCAHPRSAVVDLIEPAPATREAELVAQHGPLPWTIVVEVVDLAAKAVDLRARGTSYARVVDDVTGREALAVDPAQTEGVPFVFVAAAARSC
jgi:hypothetical protein